MILVTGGTGFLGSELIMQLLEGKEKIRAIKRDKSVIPALLSDHKNIEWVNADLLDYFSLEEALTGVKKVYHCAALVSFNSADYKKLQEINVAGTANVVNLCLEKNIEKLVHVSSVAALGGTRENRLINEEDHWVHSSQHGYAVSKYESEMEVWRGMAEGIDAVIVNPSVIIGKNAGSNGSGALFELVQRGLNFYSPGSCGFVDVEDVARIMIRLMESDIKSNRFIVSSENCTYYDLFTSAADQFGFSPPSIKLKPWMMGLAWRMAGILSLITGKNYGLTKSTAGSAFEKQEYSNKKIKETIDIKFKPINQSIAEICSALKIKKREQKVLYH